MFYMIMQYISFLLIFFLIVRTTSLKRYVDDLMSLISKQNAVTQDLIEQTKKSLNNTQNTLDSSNELLQYLRFLKKIVGQEE